MSERNVRLACEFRETKSHKNETSLALIRKENTFFVGGKELVT